MDKVRGSQLRKSQRWSTGVNKSQRLVSSSLEEPVKHGKPKGNHAGHKINVKLESTIVNDCQHESGRVNGRQQEWS